MENVFNMSLWEYFSKWQISIPQGLEKSLQRAEL